MKWPQVILAQVAPAKSADSAFASDDHVWHLGLEHIESQTGRILAKKTAPASDAGSSTYVFDDRNVLYSKLRPYLNKVVCPSEPGIATTELIPLRPKQDVLDRRFLTYYLRSRQFMQFAEQCVAGVKMPRVIMDKFWQCTIPLPPLSEQRRIVEILDQADALRKKRAEADAKAQRILPALFHHMFGDPATNPKRWKSKCLGEMLLPRDGALQSGPFGTDLHNHDFVSDGTVLAVGIDNVHDTGFELGRERRITEEKHAELVKFTLEPGDVLITIMGTVGRTCVFPEWVGKAICTKHVYRMQLDRAIIEPEYLCASIRFSSSVRAQLGASTTGQIVKGITSKDLRALQLHTPPVELQRRFIQRKHDLDAMSGTASDSGIHIETLFKSLLHRAFTGDLTSKWREAHMKVLLQEMEVQARALGGKP